MAICRAQSIIGCINIVFKDLAKIVKYHANR